MLTGKASKVDDFDKQIADIAVKQRNHVLSARRPRNR